MIDPTVVVAVCGLLILLVWHYPFRFTQASVLGLSDVLPDKPERKPWEDLLMFKKGSSKAPTPDPRIGQAALENAKLGREWLEFAREQFDVANERQVELDDLTKRVGEQQLATQDQANEWAKADRERYENVFQPIEDQFVERATTWDSPERQAQMASEARADVLRSADQERQASARQMASMGVNPASGRYAGIDRAGELGTALAAAGAQNTARNQVRQEGMALIADAANMGRGLPSQAAGAAGLGLNAGNSAIGGAMGAHSQFLNNAGIMGQGYQGAMGGYSNQANILNQQHSNQLQAWAANQQAASQGIGGLFGAIGSGIGTYAGLQSSKDSKTDKKPVEGALEAIKGLPIERWRYTKDAQQEGAPDGIIPPDGEPHIGTYAEDFQQQTGMGDGQTIPIQDAIGVTMKAVQELDDKVDRIDAAKGRKRKRARV